MSILEKEISNNNHKTLQHSKNEDSKIFNCRSKTNCPVNGDFLTKELYTGQQWCKKKKKVNQQGGNSKLAVKTYLVF